MEAIRHVPDRSDTGRREATADDGADAVGDRLRDATPRHVARVDTIHGKGSLTERTVTSLECEKAPRVKTLGMK